jgi:hypothetical protein
VNIDEISIDSNSSTYRVILRNRASVFAQRSCRIARNFRASLASVGSTSSPAAIGRTHASARLAAHSISQTVILLIVFAREAYSATIRIFFNESSILATSADD